MNNEYTIHMKGISKEFFNKLVLITLAGILIWNFDRFLGIFGTVKATFTPIFIGIIIAVIISVPMDFFEKKVFYKLKKFKIPLSLWCSVILFVGVFIGLGFLILPKIISSIQNVVESFSNGNALDKMTSKNSILEFIFVNIKKIAEDSITKLQEYMPKLLQLVENIFKVIINIFLGLFFAILILSNKEELAKESKKIMYKVIKKEKIRGIMQLFQLALDKFSKFLGGQIIEATILGTVCYLIMLIIGLPYAPLIGAITGVANLIPILGAYVGGAFSALLIFAVSPEKALIFVIFIVILQQIEAVTTYPIIVGRYVGLSSFWILTAVVVGGGLFGFTGVFLSVPVTAFLHDFVGGILTKKSQKSSLYLDGIKGNMIE